MRIIPLLFGLTALWAQDGEINPSTEKRLLERDQKSYLKRIRPLAIKKPFIPFTQTLLKGGTEARLDFLYNNSSTRFDRGGEENPFDEGEFYTQYLISGEFSYGITDHLEMGLQLRGIANQSGALDSEGVLNELSVNGLESYRFRLKFGSDARERDHWRFGIDFHYRGNLYSNPAPDTNIPNEFIVLGDQGTEIGTNFYLSYVFTGSSSSLNGRIGYRNPGAELAQEIPYGAEFVRAWKKFALVGGIDGVSSFGNSPYTDDPSGQPALDWSSTALYNSINREWIKVYGGVNFFMGDIRLDFRAGITPTGVSTDAQNFIGISLVYRKENKAATKLQRTTFTDYAVEGSVIKVSPKGGYLIVNKGLEDGVIRGMTFDIYDFNYISGNRLLAAGHAVEVRSQQAIIRLTRKFVRKPIKNGNVARGGSQ